MSKWIVFVAWVLAFNIVMGVGFVWANNCIWDFVRSEVSNHQAAYLGEDGDLYQVVAEVGFSGSLVGVGQTIIVNEGETVHGGPLPKTIQNYPYTLFWFYMIGNLSFFALAFVLQRGLIEPPKINGGRSFRWKGISAGLGVLCAVLVAVLVSSSFVYSQTLRARDERILFLQSQVDPLKAQVDLFAHEILGMQDTVSALTQPPEWREISVYPDHNETVTFGETDFFFFFISDQQSPGVGLKVDGVSGWVTLGTGLNRCLGIDVLVLEISDDWAMMTVRAQQ